MARNCGTYPMRALARPAGWPSTKTLPEAGRRSPSITFSSVLLPAPFGPRTATSSPSSMEKLTSLRMVRPPRSTRKPSAETTGVECGPGIGRAAALLTSRLRQGHADFVELAQHPGLVGLSRRHGLGHSDHGNPRGLRVLLRLGGDVGNGLLVVDEDADLLSLDLVFSLHHGVRRRIVSLRDGLLELERSQDLQAQRRRSGKERSSR